MFIVTLSALTLPTSIHPSLSLSASVHPSLSLSTSVHLCLILSYHILSSILYPLYIPYRSASLVGLVEYLVAVGHILPVLVLVHRYLCYFALPPDLEVVLRVQLLDVATCPSVWQLVDLVAGLMFGGVKVTVSPDHHVALLVNLDPIGERVNGLAKPE